jgi:hypothetical protein
MSSAIAGALKLARDAGDARLGDVVHVFSGPTGKPITRGRDGLPVAGNSLRHAYRSIAAQLGIDDVSIRLLMGHSLSGVSSGYVSRMMMQQGPSLRSAQARVSRRVIELLGLGLVER